MPAKALLCFYSGSFLRNGHFREVVFVNSSASYFAIDKEALIHAWPITNFEIGLENFC